MNWNRFSLSVLILLLCLPALFFYLLFVMSVIDPILPTSYPWSIYLVLSAGILAWLMLFYMAFLWMKSHVIPKWFSALATLLAIMGILPFLVRLDPILFAVIPGFFFALFLCHQSWKTK